MCTKIKSNRYLLVDSYRTEGCVWDRETVVRSLYAWLHKHYNIRFLGKPPEYTSNEIASSNKIPYFKT